MILRGLVKHCPRCGAGHLFDGYFRLKERCPRCGYRFDREEGFFTGTYLINFAVTEGLLFVVMMALIVVLSRNPDTAIAPILLVALGAAIVAPIAFYPHARTTWAALDLAMRPLEPVEEAEALLASQSPPAATPAEGGGPPAGSPPQR
jgi:uncharacterized protein (DUF983 family)